MANGFDDEQTVIYKLGQIESELRALTQAIIAHNTKDDTFHTATDTRLTSLEKTRTYALGFIFAISLIVQQVGNRLLPP